MERVFVTGSSAGLGRLAGEMLIARGCSVVLHARDPEGAEALRRACPGAAAVVAGDLETLAGMHAVAAAAGRCDAVIHNAGVGDRAAARLTADGLPAIFAVNALAPYLLTVLIERPARLVYIGSGMHRGATPQDLAARWRDGRWHGRIGYSETKFLVLLLAMAAARLWPRVAVNGVDPGWVPTRMGGASAPDDLDAGAETQAWLAEGHDPAAQLTGRYLYHMQPSRADPRLTDVPLQEAFLTLCADISGVSFPRS